jgi:hydroxyacylglutathione hydrolase
MTITPIKLSKSNCYLIQGDKNILVDTGNQGESQLILDNLKQHNLKISDISLILHTHGHGDHCGSTVELIKQCKIPTAIHSADNHMCIAGKSDLTLDVRFMSKILKPFVSKPFTKFSNDILIDNDFELAKFGIDADIISTPGHTSGSISILSKDGSAIIGDVLMGGYLGGKIAPTKPDYHYYATNLNQVNNSIEKLLNLKLKTFYVGHGGPLTFDKVLSWYEGKKRN